MVRQHLFQTVTGQSQQADRDFNTARGISQQVEFVWEGR
jgi:hypothetical protein